MEIKYTLRDVFLYIPLNLYILSLHPYVNKSVDFELPYTIIITIFLIIIYMVNSSFKKVISRTKSRPSEELLNSLNIWSRWLLYDSYSKNKMIYLKSTMWIIIILNLLLLEKWLPLMVTLAYIYMLINTIKHSKLYVLRSETICYLNSLSKKFPK